MKIQPDTILSRSEHASYEVVAGEAILIDPNSGTYFSLNAVGTQFWERIDGAQTIQQHADVIAEKYSVAVSQVVTDLVELADSMASNELVTTRD